MSISPFTIENPKIPIKSAVNHFFVRFGAPFVDWRINNEDHLQQLTDTSETGIFYRIEVAVNNRYILDFIALVYNDFEAMLFMDAASSVSFNNMTIQNELDAHRKEFPHTIGV